MQLIRSLVSPAKTTDKSYAQLVRLVQEHQQPTPSFIVQRYNFHTRVQQLDESISDFVAKTAKTVGTLSFWGSGMCRRCTGDAAGPISLWLHAVINSYNANYLPNQNSVIYDRAARAAETAQQEAKELHAKTEHPVHQVHVGQRNGLPRKTPTTNASCYRCGAKHAADIFIFKTATCNYTATRKAVCALTRHHWYAITHGGTF